MEFTAIVKAISGALWDNILLVLLCCTGVYFTLRLRFVQIVKFKDGFKKVFGGFRFKGKKAGKEGMSSFQALTTAIAAQIGTGNIAGAATAVVSGGPGAIFWMWISAFLAWQRSFPRPRLRKNLKPLFMARSRVGRFITLKQRLMGVLAVF